MAISRRDFLGGSLAAFGWALLPFKQAPAKEAVKAEIPLHNFDIPTQVQCSFYLEGEHVRVTGEGVQVIYPHDSKLLTQSPCQIAIRFMGGRLDHVRKFVGTLAELNHNRRVVFTFNRYPLSHVDHQARDRRFYRLLDVDWTADAAYPYPYAFTLDRPIIEASSAVVSQTPEFRCDDMGYNGGEDIYIPDAHRAGMIKSVKLLCVNAPKRVRYDEILKKIQQPAEVADGWSYDKIKQSYEERRKRQTPEQRQAEEERVIAYANNNRDPSAWEAAQEQLKGFDPQKFRKGHLTPDRFQG